MRRQSAGELPHQRPSLLDKSPTTGSRIWEQYLMATPKLPKRRYLSVKRNFANQTQKEVIQMHL